MASTLAEHVVTSHRDYHEKYDAIDAELDGAALAALTSTEEAYKDPRRLRRVIRTLAALDQYQHDHPDVESTARNR
ncbi:hypothetical protein [Burkholderia gladioli]|uniref:hypothetical protein n=1 Tax=Burkholderia gladioli TaxID=28095 RepID=UPI0016426227|nr:hypothetical protein [Burkholderia gladioli]